MDDHQSVKFVELLATFNMADVAFIKSILEANNIAYYVEGEAFNQIRPLVQPVRIKVDEASVHEVRDLLKDFQGGAFGYNL